MNSSARLKNLFRMTFPSLKDEDEILVASVSNVKEWDSLSHMHLILALCEEFNLKKLEPEKIVTFTSFQIILDYIISREEF